jgi:hypothetical protein
MGATNDTAIEVEDAGGPTILQEESEDDERGLAEIPIVDTEGSPEDSDSLFVEEETSHRRSKRSRARTSTESELASPMSLDHASKRQRGEMDGMDESPADDKKKMAMDTSYDGFAIYGRVLCLVVKRKENKGKPQSTTGGQAMMEDWIASTQMPAQVED